jgi:hypothetical protein
VPFSNEIVPAFFGTTQLLGGGNHAAVVAFGNAIFQRSSARTIKSRYRAQRAAMLSGGLPIALAICRSEHAQCVRRAGNKSLACSIAAIASAKEGSRSLSWFIGITSPTYGCGLGWMVMYYVVI